MRRTVWAISFCCLLVGTALTTSAEASKLADTTWQVTLDTGSLGPIEFYLHMAERDGALYAHSNSAALDLIRALPGAQGEEVDLRDGLLSFVLEPAKNGYVGRLMAPWRNADVVLEVVDGQLKGSLKGSWFAGDFVGKAVESTKPLRDYVAIIERFDGVVADKVFQPKELNRAAYQQFRQRLGAIAAVANDDLDLLLGADFAWTNEPFSHFQLRRFPAPAEAIIAHFDQMRVGYEAARVEFDGALAILRVDTMMGNDTIEQIEAAYAAIDSAASKALIIDLRGNGGGAFAVKSLVGHVIDEPLYPGYFVAQKWNAVHDRQPTAQELEAIAPWSGWSISAFWRSIQDEGIMRLRFMPAEPNFDGPVYVLVDGGSASATELAIDAFRSSGAVTLVGEKTPGQMLSQSFFDVSDGFVVTLPVADYFSVQHGRIEGVGVDVDVRVRSDQALDKAKALAEKALRQP
ncbi:MAG: hypothetical protein ACI8PG_001101 [Planctomycetota bacterium]|jgi:hypothetical protein